MKVLIVEDSDIKKSEIVRILIENGIFEYDLEKSAIKAIRKLHIEHYDMLITNLENIKYSEYGNYKLQPEGLKILLDLSYNFIRIPTIIYSKTPRYNEEIGYLKEIGQNFLYMKHIKDINTLSLLMNYLVKQELLKPFNKSDDLSGSINYNLNEINKINKCKVKIN